MPYALLDNDMLFTLYQIFLKAHRAGGMKEAEHAMFQIDSVLIERGM